MVVKRGNRWYVISHTTRKVLGRKDGYLKKADAEAFLHFIESGGKGKKKKGKKR